MPQLSHAQTAPPPAAPGQPSVAPPNPQAMQRLQQAEQALRDAMQKMTSAQGAQQQQAVPAVRQALTQLQQAMSQTPATPGRRAADQQVTEAQKALEGDRVDATRARTELDQVFAALQSARAGMGAAGQAAPGAAEVVVREASPSIQVQQATPQVSVVQGEPVVTVVVPQPEIIVRQPPPQVTVVIPEPKVNVATAQPEVRVIESQPQVSVAPAQPQVQVQRAEPRVVVQQAEGQPKITYEQQGQPVVRTEQTGQAAPPRQEAAVAGATQPAARAAAGMPLQQVQKLVGTNVVGANGRDAGEVENLLIDQTGNVRGAVIQWGGFLGIGERRAVVPLDQIQFGGPDDRAKLTMTKEQLEQLGNYDRNNLGQYATRYGWGDGIRLYR